LDLFERRYKVYQALQTLVHKVAIHGPVKAGDLQEFAAGIDGAEFLFPEELAKHLRKIQSMCGDAAHARLRISYRQIHGDDGRLEGLLDEEDAVLEYVRDEQRHLLRDFKNHLDLSKAI